MNKVGLIGNGNKSWIAGVQYSQSLIMGNNLLDADQKMEFHLFLHQDFHQQSDYKEVQGYLKTIKYFDFYYGKSWPLAYKSYQFLKKLQKLQFHWPQDRLQKWFVEQSIDSIFPANELLVKNSPVRQICWVADFQQVHFPEYFSAYDIRYRYRQLKKIAALADVLVVSNEHSRRDAIRLVPEVASKIRVLPFTMWLGKDWNKVDVQPYLAKYNLPPKFLILPSQWWKHKNHLVVFQALELLLKMGVKDISLVCTGLPSDPRFPSYAQTLRNYITQANLQPYIYELGLIPRQDQVQLMRAAMAVVQPSFFEGWSALVEDCRSLDKTIFLSDIPMHHEHQNRNMIFFDPHSAKDLANKIIQNWSVLNSKVASPNEEGLYENYTNNLKKFTSDFVRICQNY
ncbi:glycosyltransferase family 4 protein [Telluribacter humicola]|uniref:glycosyltransferase family 4 protein n=1 Tax=Telluribacter humicola TaxID=1720261 RepID=UPI001A97A29D|nr:glycosyltransferase family 1 protein [Telluribacter humicola]